MLNMPRSMETSIYGCLVNSNNSFMKFLSIYSVFKKLIQPILFFVLLLILILPLWTRVLKKMQWIFTFLNMHLTVQDKLQLIFPQNTLAFNMHPMILATLKQFWSPYLWVSLWRLLTNQYSGCCCQVPSSGMTNL